MDSCSTCGVELPASANYCSACGAKLQTSTDEDSIDRFWELIEEMVDSQVDQVIENMSVEITSTSLLDKHVFALKMYIAGFVKGLVYTLFLQAAQEWEDQEFQDLDLSPLYERIIDRVDEQEDRIEAALKPAPE